MKSLFRNRLSSLLLILFSATMLPASLPAAEPTATRAPAASNNLLRNGDFESGLAAPWGTGRYSEGRPVWWTSKECKCTAQVDPGVQRIGSVSLRITNYSPLSPHVYGTTAQRIAIEPRRTYRITLWAKASRLASSGAVFVVVDDEWNTRPIVLPKGTFSWRKFEGTFSLPVAYADVRIVSQDRGLAWIDDVQVVPLQGAFVSP
jgi:hypothetical protein